SSLAEKWLHSLASRNCLKELSLTICGKKICLGYRISNLTIPAEIFSCEKLNIVSLIVDHRAKPVTVNMNHVMIKCLFLRVLELVNVRISSEEALNTLFSSCFLLEKINIFFRQEFKFIKVKNLCCLRELRIRFVAAKIDNIVEINDVPILRVFHYNSIPDYTFKMDSLRSVRELVLLRDVVDDAFINMVNSKFPFLETLSLTMLKCRHFEALGRKARHLGLNREETGQKKFQDEFSIDGVRISIISDHVTIANMKKPLDELTADDVTKP
nr:hypothetical protein [Tanacetum cinerariifolium]